MKRQFKEAEKESLMLRTRPTRCRLSSYATTTTEKPGSAAAHTKYPFVRMRKGRGAPSDTIFFPSTSTGGLSSQRMNGLSDSVAFQLSSIGGLSFQGMTGQPIVLSGHNVTIKMPWQGWNAEIRTTRRDIVEFKISENDLTAASHKLVPRQEQKFDSLSLVTRCL